MFSWLKSSPDSRRMTHADKPVSSETIEARLADIEARLKLVERRWAPGDQRTLDAALAKLGEHVAREEANRQDA